MSAAEGTHRVAVGARPSPNLARLLVMMCALGVAAAGMTGLAALLHEPPPVPVRNPFGAGLREAAPAAGGWGGWLLAMQAGFHRLMTQSLIAARDAGVVPVALIGLSFAYGVFHAAGPGHGKAVIAGYIVASERTLLRGVGLSTGAALFQALVAIAIVGVGALLFNATAAGMTRTTRWVELASFAAVLAVGLWATWRKAGPLAAVLAAPAGTPQRASALAECCGTHAAMHSAARPLSLRETAGVIVAAGARPCAGAIVVLVFALSQQMFGVGVLAVLAMAAGTALATSALAALAVFAKRAALGLAAGRPRLALAGPLLELAAAAFVAVLGGLLLAGLWTATGGA